MILSTIIHRDLMQCLIFSKLLVLAMNHAVLLLMKYKEPSNEVI